MVSMPYNNFNPSFKMPKIPNMTKITSVNPKQAVQTITTAVTKHKTPLLFIVFVLLAIIFIIVYIYQYFKKKKKKDKKENIYPGYSLPCPDYWLGVSGNKKTNGICYNPKKLGTCRQSTNIHYGDHIYIVNLTNKYISLHKDDVSQKPLSINTQMSYNPDISYLTLTDTISSCNQDIDNNIDSLSCYEKKNIINKINYNQSRGQTHIISQMNGSLDEAKEKCNNSNDKDVPIEWLEWTHPDLEQSNVSDSRKRELVNNKSRIKNKLFICNPSTKNTENCLNYYSEKNKLPDKMYYKMIDKQTYQWTKIQPTNEDIPPSMTCMGIKNEDNIYKLIYGNNNLPESSLIEGTSDDKVWVRSFCKNDIHKKELTNALIPTDNSIWILEHCDDAKNKESITYYTTNSKKKSLFYITCKDKETRNKQYITICNNNVNDTTQQYISAPSNCTSDYMSIVSTKKHKKIDTYKWFFYKVPTNNKADIIQTKDDPTSPIQSTDKVYIASMYKYDKVNNKPTYLLGTCGKKKNNKYLQLIKITDIEQSDTIWSFIVKTSSTGNPIISEVDFKSILGIPDINNNLDVANNNHNLKKKCEWAKSCGLTWDVVDKMC